VPRPGKYAERLVAHWPSDMAAEALLLQELRYGISRKSGYK
jgi:hypothetical protein